MQQQLPRAASSKQQPCMCTYLQVKLRLLPPPIVLLCCPLRFQLLCSMLCSLYRSCAAQKGMADAMHSAGSWYMSGAERR